MDILYTRQCGIVSTRSFFVKGAYVDAQAVPLETSHPRL